jgi:TonB family protein
VDARSGTVVVIVPWADQDLLAGSDSERATVEALVDDAGRVDDARIAGSTGIAALDAQAVRAVRDLLFRPASRAGRPVPAHLLQRVEVRRE